MATLTVGTGSQYQFHTIAAAVAATQNGDVVLVQAGTYNNDFLDFSDSITLQAVGGMVVINATVPPPDKKAIITEGGAGVSVTISGFELAGATISLDDGGNAAGIRYQGGNLTLTNDYIFNNQNGIMGNPASPGDGTVSISNCEFAGNGSGNGLTHNIYIGNVATLSVTNSLIYAANGGHEIKSRAQNTVITNNVIADGPNGTGSYAIDLPNGGNATITGNVIEKGPHAPNYTFIAYGEEGVGVNNPGTSVSISGNTFLNDLTTAGAGTAVWNATGTNILFSSNKVFNLSAGQFFKGAGSASSTTTLTTEPTVNTTPPWMASLSQVGVKSVTTSLGFADAGAGTTLTISLNFNAPVTVTGTPTLTLNDGGTATYAGTNGNAVTFTYTVQAGENAPRLAVAAVNLLSGATIQDGTGNNVNLSAALTTPAARLFVDTTRTRTDLAFGNNDNIDASAGNAVVTLAAGSASMTFGGTNDIAFIGGGSGPANATIIDNSTGLKVFVASAGVSAIKNFAADPTMVIDLLGGVGGIANTIVALHSLSSDGNGGTLLSLSGPGQLVTQYIDFVGVPASALKASNFQFT